MKPIRLFAFFAAATLLLPFCGLLPFADTAEDTFVMAVDSVNGTRWADMICVYKDRPSTLQNEWGWNIVVSAEGIATEKIEGGDSRGKDLAIPQGGFVVTGTGDKGLALYEGIEVGDYVVFDAYGMRVLASKGKIDPFYEAEIVFTHFNAPRYSNTIVIYNKGGTKTGTNVYGYEAVVDAEGYVIAAGGNNSEVPEGGFVISAIEPADQNTLRMYCIPGAKCVIDGWTVIATYDETMLVDTVDGELSLLEEEFALAASQLRLIDYESIRSKMDALDATTVSSLEERDEILEAIEELRQAMVESRDVEVRGVWYVPLERNEEAVFATVEEMKRVGINQLNLGLINGGRSYLYISNEHPFPIEPRVRRFDLLGAYVKACKEYDIELIASIPVFYGCGTDRNPDWLATPNKQIENAETFASPANEEYVAVMKEYLEYIIRHYDIDGIQYDYIRYPYFDGNVDYGYDEASKALFAKETGLAPTVVDEIGAQLRSHPNWKDWVEFKVNLIHRRVEEYSAMIREIRPDLYISAAVADDTATESYFQDSSLWMQEGWVDGIYPMSYAEGIMERATKKFSGFLTDDTFLVMGNGAYQSLSLAEMYLQTNQTAVFGADGISYFEWGAYKDHGYAASFASTVFAKPALSFTHKESQSISALVSMAKARLQLWFDNHPAIDTAFPEELFEKSLQEIYDGMKAMEDNPYLLQDMELALRIQAFSKEDRKDDVTIEPPTAYDDEQEDGGESSAPSEESKPAEESQAAQTSSAASQNQEGTESGFPWWILAVIGVVAAGVIGLLVWRSKK